MLVSLSKPFCVYTHAMDGVIFYVGKGDYARACSTRTRNRLWKDKVAGKDFIVNVVSTHKTDFEAMRAEIALIKELKPECNLMHRVSAMTPERCEALRAARKGVKRTDQHRQNMRAGWKASLAKGSFPKLKLSPVVCIETGIKYYSTKEAGRQMGIDAGSIRKMIIGEVRHVGGYTFKYADN